MELTDPARDDVGIVPYKETGGAEKSVFMICFQFCDASFKSTGYSIIRKVAEAVSRTFRSADPSFLPLFFLTPFAPSAPLIFSGALNFLHEGA